MTVTEIVFKTSDGRTEGIPVPDYHQYGIAMLTEASTRERGVNIEIALRVVMSNMIIAGVNSQLEDLSKSQAKEIKASYPWRN